MGFRSGGGSRSSGGSSRSSRSRTSRHRSSSSSSSWGRRSYYGPGWFGPSYYGSSMYGPGYVHHGPHGTRNNGCSKMSCGIVTLFLTFFVSLVVIGTSQSAGNDRFELAAQETRLWPVSAFTYNEVSVSALSSDVNTYVLGAKPALVADSYVPLKKDVAISVPPGGFEFRARYLNKGTKVRVHAETSHGDAAATGVATPVQFFVFRGQSKFDKYKDGEDEHELHRGYGPHVDVDFVVQSDADYFFVLENSASSTSLRVDLTLDVQLTQYDVSSIANPTYFGSFVHKLSVPNDLGQYLVFKSARPLGQDGQLIVEVSSSVNWWLIVGSVALFMSIASISLWILCCSKQERERQQKMAEWEAQQHQHQPPQQQQQLSSTSHPTGEVYPHPPSYDDARHDATIPADYKPNAYGDKKRQVPPYAPNAYVVPPTAPIIDEDDDIDGVPPEDIKYPNLNR